MKDDLYRPTKVIARHRESTELSWGTARDLVLKTRDGVLPHAAVKTVGGRTPKKAEREVVLLLEDIQSSGLTLHDGDYVLRHDFVEYASANLAWPRLMCHVYCFVSEMRCRALA